MGSRKEEPSKIGPSEGELSPPTQAASSLQIVSETGPAVFVCRTPMTFEQDHRNHGHCWPIRLFTMGFTQSHSSLRSSVCVCVFTEKETSIEDQSHLWEPCVSSIRRFHSDRLRLQTKWFSVSGSPIGLRVSDRSPLRHV